MSANNLKAWSHLSVSIQVSYSAILSTRKRQIDAHQHAGQTHLRQITCPGQFQHDDLVNVRLPMLFCPTPEIATADQSSLVVICAVIRRSRMWNIDRDHRNTSLSILGGNNRRDRLVGLKFDC